ncbi:3-carboxy-cis,cis-muconate cycloisomerase [Phaeobacter sp. HF9A]|uniref:3-carboxy-cis,cis-muconate cycloisomerase n=1 Tax=Phaeobacter sp. HF9A TaxID=2721561 RepID=UPI001430F8DF|nr:3-carboxy-cis,cis-muconate cycloisomerase [Phaeobacter sp. HF9A]NIZ14591.1 3-carboxy-cis,cis-muconate cycloisomerase [Phaeobacter sp. HF9A]
MTNPLTRGLFGPMYCDDAVATLFSAPAFTRHMLAFEAAWTRALETTGVVSAAQAEPALQAIIGFEGTDFSAESAVDGLPVPGFVRALRSGLDADVAKAIHSGATSQDVIDSAMALTLLQLEHMLTARLKQVAKQLAELNQRFGGAALMGRTRMQAALPATASLRINAWQRAIDGQIDRAADARAEIAKVQLGGAIGLRNSPEGKSDAVASAVAQELGLSLVPVWHSDRSGPVAFGHWLTLVSGSLGKIGQDVALMAQQGLDEIALRGGGGSSAMPHKQNPVAAEAMITLARFTASQQGALAQAMIHEQERSGAAWALEWMTLPPMAEATGAALNHCLALLDQIDRIGSPQSR